MSESRYDGSEMKKNVIKRVVDCIPLACFPKVTESSLKTIGIVGFSLGIATMLERDRARDCCGLQRPGPPHIRQERRREAGGV